MNLKLSKYKPSNYYRKRGSASYILREVHSVREKEREREREKLIPKIIGNRKRDCEVARGDKPNLRKSTDRKAQISPLLVTERTPS